MKTVPRLTLDDARVMMAAAEKKACEIGVDMDIAITDDSGSLLMFHRMDNARITSIDIAISKAFTAAAARKSTRAYGETSMPGGPSYGIHVSNHGRFMIVRRWSSHFCQQPDCRWNRLQFRPFRPG